MTLSPRRVAVVVVAHRQYATLELCLRGFREIVAAAADLVFVDNGSGGKLADCIIREAPGATLITLRENRNFCGGYNAGIQWALDRDYDYVLIVNADTEVANPQFVDSLVDAMERNADVAFVGPLVYYRDLSTVQNTCLTYPDILRSILVWLPFRVFPELITWQSKNERQVEFLNGVCVLCRSKALREIGLMDESFEAYVEDADWAWRARSKGWRSLFSPVPSVIHHEEPHGYEHYSLKNLLLKRNTVRWFLKAGKRRSAWIYANASLILAHVRTLAATNNAQERNVYRQFAFDLSSAYRHLLSTSTTDALTPSTRTDEMRVTTLRQNK